MLRSTLISLVLCLGVSIALFGWLFMNEPLPEMTRVKTAETIDQKSAVPSVVPNATSPRVKWSESVVQKPVAQKPVDQNQRAVVFSKTRSKATALNDVPVNIVINPGSQKVQVQAGAGDLVVSSSGLRMRSEPSSSSEMLGKYSRGAQFAHIRDQNGWALVQSLDDGQKGWMFKKYMTKNGG